MNHYDLLAVPRDASDENIRASYAAQVNLWSSSADPAADQRRAQIETAYVVLTDPGLRTTYDARLSEEGASTSTASNHAGRLPTIHEIAAYENQPAAVLARDAFRAQRWGGFWLRVGAHLLDGFVLYVPATVLLAFEGALAAMHTPPLVIIASYFGSYALLYAVYDAWLISSEHLSTWGRRATGLAVVSAIDGEAISFSHAFGRSILSFICVALVFPNLLQLFTAQRQSFSDLIAGTVVVRKSTGGGSGGNVLAIAMVVVFVGLAMVGLLAAIAIPGYQDYTVRARVIQEYAVAKTYEALVIQNALVGSSDLSRGFVAPEPGPLVASVAMSTGGTITVVMSANAKFVSFTLYPSWTGNKSAPGTGASKADGGVTWNCRVDTARNNRLVPTECRI